MRVIDLKFSVISWSDSGMKVMLTSLNELGSSRFPKKHLRLIILFFFL